MAAKFEILFPYTPLLTINGYATPQPQMYSDSDSSYVLHFSFGGFIMAKITQHSISRVDIGT